MVGLGNADPVSLGIMCIPEWGTRCFFFAVQKDFEKEPGARSAFESTASCFSLRHLLWLDVRPPGLGFTCELGASLVLNSGHSSECYLATCRVSSSWVGSSLLRGPVLYTITPELFPCAESDLHGSSSLHPTMPWVHTVTMWFESTSGVSYSNLYACIRPPYHIFSQWRFCARNPSSLLSFTAKDYKYQRWVSQPHPWCLSQHNQPYSMVDSEEAREEWRIWNASSCWTARLEIYSVEDSCPKDWLQSKQTEEHFSVGGWLSYRRSCHLFQLVFEANLHLLEESECTIFLTVEAKCLRSR